MKLKWLNSVFLILTLPVLLWNSMSALEALASSWISSSTSWQEKKDFRLGKRVTRLRWLYLQALQIFVNNDGLDDNFFTRVQLFSESVSHEYCRFGLSCMSCELQFQFDTVFSQPLCEACSHCENGQRSEHWTLPLLIAFSLTHEICSPSGKDCLSFWSVSIQCLSVHGSFHVWYMCNKLKMKLY